MITAQDIREKTFEKARMGGYDMASVDDFLEELADEIAAAQKENAVLKSKMKVLVDKIEEYRANEEALNMAILSAQKLAVQIEAEARQRASATVADAEAKAKAVIGSIDEERISYEKRLAAAKEAKASFIAEAKALAQAQLDKLSAIDTGDVAQGAEAVKEKADTVADAVQSIGNKASRLESEPSFDIDLSMLKETPAPSKLESTQTFTV